MRHIQMFVKTHTECADRVVSLDSAMYQIFSGINMYI
jgi:hypothetical protein